MENGNDFSSSLSFPSSSYLSNSSNSNSMSSTSSCEAGTDLDLLSLNRLSSSLEKLLADPEYGYSDALIEVEGMTVGVNRCILAARSDYFHNLFKKDKDGWLQESKKPKYLISEMVKHGRVGYEAFTVVLNYIYTGKMKSSPPEVATCIDKSCAHEACGPAVNYAVEMMYASTTFQIKELIMVVQRRLLDFVNKAFVEDVIPILMVAFHRDLKELKSHCVERIQRSDLENIFLERELPHEVFEEIKSFRTKSNQDDQNNVAEVDSLNNKRIQRIHRALDSDDVELVKLLLDESNISLDVAYALHYAAACCNPKIMDKLLSLGNADVKLRDSRGFTVLHVAARRKEPSVVMSLLAHGSCVSDKTRDGQTPLTICRRLTRPKDFNEKTERGKETHKDQLCIEVMEREMLRNPSAVTISMSSFTGADDLQMTLLFFENRVAIARFFFPHEARLAMQISHADATVEFAGVSASKGLCTSSNQQRLQALQRTVETGRRFFPNCSEFLDKLSEDDISGTLLLDKGTPDERKKKRGRYEELKGELMKEFDKDIAVQKRAVFSSYSSCSSSKRGRVMQRPRR